MAVTDEWVLSGAVPSVIGRLLRRIKALKDGGYEHRLSDHSPKNAILPRTSMLQGLPRVVMDPNATKACSDALAAGSAGDRRWCCLCPRQFLRCVPFVQAEFAQGCGLLPAV